MANPDTSLLTRLATLTVDVLALLDENERLKATVSDLETELVRALTQAEAHETKIQHDKFIDAVLLS